MRLVSVLLSFIALVDSAGVVRAQEVPASENNSTIILSPPPVFRSGVVVEEVPDQVPVVKEDVEVKAPATFVPAVPEIRLRLLDTIDKPKNYFGVPGRLEILAEFNIAQRPEGGVTVEGMGGVQFGIGHGLKVRPMSRGFKNSLTATLGSDTFWILGGIEHNSDQDEKTKKGKTETRFGFGLRKALFPRDNMGDPFFQAYYLEAGVKGEKGDWRPNSFVRVAYGIKWGKWVSEGTPRAERITIMPIPFVYQSGKGMTAEKFAEAAKKNPAIMPYGTEWDSKHSRVLTPETHPRLDLTRRVLADLSLYTGVAAGVAGNIWFNKKWPEASMGNKAFVSVVMVGSLLKYPLAIRKGAHLAGCDYKPDQNVDGTSCASDKRHDIGTYSYILGSVSSTLFGFLAGM